MKNYKLKITVTKDVLKRSMMCGVLSQCEVVTNCAVALAVRDIFPSASVMYSSKSAYMTIRPFHYPDNNIEISLPHTAKLFINEFDNLNIIPEKRLDLPEITFEVEIPDEVIDKIDISKIYEGHPTLQLFESIDN